MPEIRFSVCIPACNEENSLVRVVENVQASALWNDARTKYREIVICDNGSVDRTLEVARSLASKDVDVRVMRLEEKGKNRALNNMAATCSERADYVFFMDADCVADPEAFGVLLKVLHTRETVMIAGALSIPISNDGDWFQRWASSVGSSPVSVQRRIESGLIVGALFATRRHQLVELLAELPLDPRVPDDTFLNGRYPDQIALVANARVYYKPGNLLDHFRKVVRHSVDDSVLPKEYPEVYRGWLRHYANYSFSRREYFMRSTMSGKAFLLFRVIVNFLAKPVAA